MAAPDLVVGIGAEYVGAPAFAKANRSITGLQNSVNKLGKTFAGLFAAQKLAAYGKASVQAFNADNQSAKRLTQTLDSLGLAFEDSRVKTLIASMEKTYKVADDNLRPAMQSLLQVTGSVSKSQSILETALNASAATGTDLATTTQDLAQAYVGNLRGLRKYNLGLTQAELTTKSFAQIQEILNQKFKGQALLKAADPMQQLALAADNAKEVIGKGLVDAINAAVGAGTGVNDITTNMNHLAESTSTVLRLLGDVAGGINKVGSKIFFSTNKKDYSNGPLSRLFGSGISPYKTGTVTGKYGPNIDPTIALRAKAEKDAIARNKELLKLAQAQAKAAADAAKSKKEAAILEKANQLFNMDLIENIAALQGKITADEKLRLQTQQALLLGNAESAGQLAMKLLESQKAAMELRQIDPFGNWTNSAADALKAIQAMIDALKALGIQAEQTKMMNPVAWGLAYTSSTGQSSNDPNSSWYEYTHGLSGGLYGSTPANNTVNVVVSVDPVNGNINASTQNQSLQGTPVTVTRYNPIIDR